MGAAVTVLAPESTEAGEPNESSRTVNDARDQADSSQCEDDGITMDDDGNSNRQPSMGNIGGNISRSRSDSVTFSIRQPSSDNIVGDSSLAGLDSLLTFSSWAPTSDNLIEFSVERLKEVYEYIQSNIGDSMGAYDNLYETFNQMVMNGDLNMASIFGGTDGGGDGDALSRMRSQRRDALNLQPVETICGWDIGISHSLLNYSLDWQCVTRNIGSIGYFPAAFALCNSTRSGISIRLEHAPRRDSYFSFGLALKTSVLKMQSNGMMDVDLPDYIGTFEGSWGVRDRRSNQQPCEVFAQYLSVCQMRTLREGDVVSLYLDTRNFHASFNAGFCLLLLNGEVQHTFTGLDCSAVYVMGCTLCDSYSIRVLPDYSIGELLRNRDQEDSLDISRDDEVALLNSTVRSAASTTATITTTPPAATAPTAAAVDAVAETIATTAISSSSASSGGSTQEIQYVDQHHAPAENMSTPSTPSSQQPPHTLTTSRSPATSQSSSRSTSLRGNANSSNSASSRGSIPVPANFPRGLSILSAPVSPSPQQQRHNAAQQLREQQAQEREELLRQAQAQAQQSLRSSFPYIARDQSLCNNSVNFAANSDSSAGEQLQQQRRQEHSGDINETAVEQQQQQQQQQHERERYGAAMRRIIATAASSVSNSASTAINSATEVVNSVSNSESVARIRVAAPNLFRSRSTDEGNVMSNNNTNDSSSGSSRSSRGDSFRNPRSDRNSDNGGSGGDTAYASSERNAKALHSEATWSQEDQEEQIIEEEAQGKKKLEAEQQEKQQKESMLEDENKFCCFCMAEQKCVVLLPCKHLCLCEHCGLTNTAKYTIRNCPICRIAIKDRIRVFW